MDNKVYNVTKFLGEHPGGPDEILNFAGRDATEGFVKQKHSNYANKMKERYAIGMVEGF
jgi:cytochrome b involved in lipid metabolism